MDEKRIDEIAREVMSKLAERPSEPQAPPDVDARLSALERVVFGGATPRAQVPSGGEPATVHPSEALLRVPGGVEGQPCILEPSKLCVGSGRCRSFGF